MKKSKDFEMITFTRSEWALFLVMCMCERESERKRECTSLNVSYFVKEENCRTKDCLISNVKPSLELTE